MARKNLERAAIEARAYELYEQRGRLPGGEEQDWLQAEQDLQQGEDESATAKARPRAQAQAQAETPSQSLDGEGNGVNGAVRSPTQKRRARSF